MGLFNRKPATRAEVIEWTSRQMAARAESLEAQRAAMQAQRAGAQPEEIVWQFQTTQWPVVVTEADRHFKHGIVGMQAQDLFRDTPAMHAATRATVSALFPMTAPELMRVLTEALNNLADNQGWRRD